MTLSDNTTISTVLCQKDTNSYNDNGCSEWKNGNCIKCYEDNFFPVKVDADSRSICMDINVSLLCEEYDLDMLRLTK